MLLVWEVWVLISDDWNKTRVSKVKLGIFEGIQDVLAGED